jgi:hypothetical protein
MPHPHTLSRIDEVSSELSHEDVPDARGPSQLASPHSRPPLYLGPSQRHYALKPHYKGGYESEDGQSVVFH